MSVLLRLLRSSPSLHHLITPFAHVIHPFLSTSTTQALPPLVSLHFAPVDYLIQSCGLTSDKAIRSCEKLQHLRQTLKSPDKPEAVLHFLRQFGLSECCIKVAVIWDPRILHTSVENNLRPNLAKLQEIGLSTEDISCIISNFPRVVLFNFVAKVDFWMQALGSAEIVSRILKRDASILCSNLEKVVVPNLSFLQEEYCMSRHKIVRLIKSNPRYLIVSLETLKLNAKRAEKLGIKRSSGMFVNALVAVSGFSQNNIEAKLLYLKSLGLSQEEVALMISKSPSVLTMQEELVGRKMKFLIKDACCDKIDVVRNPVLLGLSLEKRFIPRNLVRMLLKSKEFPVENQAYVDVCGGKIASKEWFKRNSS